MTRSMEQGAWGMLANEVRQSCKAGEQVDRM
jgi:hypothetical protein